MLSIHLRRHKFKFNFQDTTDTFVDAALTLKQLITIFCTAITISTIDKQFKRKYVITGVIIRKYQKHFS